VLHPLAAPDEDKLGVQATLILNDAPGDIVQDQYVRPL
jgi:hypothetical protein